MTAQPAVMRHVARQRRHQSSIGVQLADNKREPAPAVLYIHRRELPGYEKYEFRWEHLVSGATGLAICLSTTIVILLIIWALAQSMGVIR